MTGIGLDVFHAAFTTVAAVVLLFLFVLTIAAGMGWIARDRAARRMVVEQIVLQALGQSDSCHNRSRGQFADMLSENTLVFAKSG